MSLHVALYYSTSVLEVRGHQLIFILIITPAYILCDQFFEITFIKNRKSQNGG
jgi:hypothetical protein